MTYRCDSCYYGGGAITCEANGEWTDYPVCYSEFNFKVFKVCWLMKLPNFSQPFYFHWNNSVNHALTSPRKFRSLHGKQTLVKTSTFQTDIFANQDVFLVLQDRPAVELHKSNWNTFFLCPVTSSEIKKQIQRRKTVVNFS